MLELLYWGRGGGFLQIQLSQTVTESSNEHL